MLTISDTPATIHRQRISGGRPDRNQVNLQPSGEHPGRRGQPDGDGFQQRRQAQLRRRDADGDQRHARKMTPTPATRAARPPVRRMINPAINGRTNPA